ncbi:MAG: hypothetical protein P4L31_01295 [Candidatus Babeliales bacterium]|nr:hypothetical protein [Candidatus Babeliales bacterium]
MIQKHTHMIIATFVMLASGISFASSQIVKINDAALFASHKLGKIDLYHQDGRFHVVQNNKLHAVENHCLDKKLRNIDKQKLATFLAHGHLAINTTDSGEFKIRANDHLNGGGPILGCITAVVGGVVTGVSATGVFIVSLPAGPLVAVGAATITAKAGIAGTVYATIAATASPTP